MTIDLTEAADTDTLFSSMPKRFPAQVSHRQSVLRLPPEAKRLGTSEKEAHQAIAFGPRAWGIQFHPEFDFRIIDHFIRYHASSVAATGGNVEIIQQNTRPTPESSSLLLQFAQLVRNSTHD